MKKNFSMRKIRVCGSCNSPLTIFMESFHCFTPPVVFKNVAFSRQREEGHYPISMELTFENLEQRLEQFAERGIEFSAEARQQIRDEIELHGKANII